MINRETKNKLAEIQQKHRELERRRNTIGENIRPIREKMALINAKHLVAIGTMKDEKGETSISHRKDKASCINGSPIGRCRIPET